MTATKTPAFHKPPLFTRQQLIALLLPLIAEQALSVTIGLADTLMVSSVGEAAGFRREPCGQLQHPDGSRS